MHPCLRLLKSSWPENTQLPLQECRLFTMLQAIDSVKKYTEVHVKECHYSNVFRMFQEKYKELREVHVEKCNHRNVFRMSQEKCKEMFRSLCQRMAKTFGAIK